MSGQPILETKEVWFAYTAEHPVLRGVSLTIARGEFIALIGQNGSGKTTLAKHFNGLLRPARGMVFLEGNNVRDRPIGEIAATVGFVFQNPDRQIFSATVYDEIAFGPRNLGFDASHVERLTQNALAVWDLQPHAQSSPAALSFGLRRKVTLAAVYAMQTPVLILDEPTAGLDRHNTRTMMDLFRRLHGEGRTIVLITHDMRLVADYVPKSIVLEKGNIVLQGATRALFQETETLAGTKLEPPQVTRLAQRLAPVGIPNTILTVNEFCDAFVHQVQSKKSL